MNATRTVSESGGLPAHHIDAFLDRSTDGSLLRGIASQEKKSPVCVLWVDEAQEHRPD